MPNKKPQKGFPKAPLDEELDEFFADDEVEAPAPGVPTNQEDIGNPLWSTYGVHPNLPFRIKVEKLMAMWGLEPEEIADVLEEPLDRVKSEVARLSKEWGDLGATMTDDERDVERGKLIRELLKVKAELEMAYAAKPDHRLLTAKLNVIDRIAKLRGVERDKNEQAEEETKTSLQEKMANLSPDQRRELLERLSGSKKP